MSWLRVNERKHPFLTVKAQRIGRRRNPFILSYRIHPTTVGRRSKKRRIRNAGQPTPERPFPCFLIEYIHTDAFLLRPGVTTHQQIQRVCCSSGN